METNHAGAQAHRNHTGRQFGEMIVDQFEELLEQLQPQGRARARTPPDPSDISRSFDSSGSPRAPTAGGRAGAEKIDGRQRA
jgi:hypothetical protein